MAVSSNDALGCFGSALLALIGGRMGWEWLGLLGAVAGVPVGAFLGFLGGHLLIDAMLYVADPIARYFYRRQLKPRFGAYWSSERRADWERAVADLKVGEALRGEVVAQFEYGIAIDVGAGFPAILTKRRYAEPFSDNPPDGAFVEARIEAFDARRRELHLTQLPGRKSSVTGDDRLF